MLRANSTRIPPTSSDLTKLLPAATNRDEAEDGGVKPKNFADYEIFKKNLKNAMLANIRDLLDFELVLRLRMSRQPVRLRGGIALVP